MTLHPPLEISSRETNGIHYVDVQGRLTIGDPSDHLSTFVQNWWLRRAQGDHQSE